MVFEFEEELHRCGGVLQARVVLALDLHVDMLLDQVLQLANPAILVALEFEIGRIDVGYLVEPKSFKVTDNAVADKHNCLPGRLFKLSDNLLEMVDDLSLGWGSFE